MKFISAWYVSSVTLHYNTCFSYCSCTRNRTVALDNSGGIWGFDNWAYPVRLNSSILDPSSDGEVAQIQCTSSVCTALLKNGDVLAWWSNGITQLPEEPIRSTDLTPDDDDVDGRTLKAIRCILLRSQVEFCRLPAIPTGVLPPIHSTGRTGWSERPRLVKIAAMGYREQGDCEALLGLTKLGHVVIFRDMQCRMDAEVGNWEYVSDRDFWTICILSGVFFALFS